MSAHPLPGQPDPSPLVSIVLPTLNGSRYLAEALSSILGQSYRHMELIVVEGGSTDGTLDIVASMADPRMQVLRQRDLSGKLPGALNEGFAQATGAYFTWAQDDDTYAPEAIAVMVRALNEQPDVGLVYAGYHVVDAAGQFIRAARLGPPEGLHQSNVVGHCFLYRRSVAEKAGPYDPAFYMAEDTHFWLRVYKHSRLRQLAGSYYFHRLHDGSLTVRDYGRYRALRVSARARRAVLRISWWDYTRQVSAAYIEEAFAAYAQRDLRRVRRCLLHGLARNPTWLRNWGVWSIGLRSLLGTRAAPVMGRTKKS